jgi:hypothetical protein
MAKAMMVNRFLNAGELTLCSLKTALDAAQNIG